MNIQGVESSIEIDDRLAEPHSSLGFIHFNGLAERGGKPEQERSQCVPT
jgi:hypothetical protein